MTRSIADLSAAVTRRNSDLFASDVARFDGVIREHIRGRRLLVIGGAGSIGSSTVRALVPYLPAAVHVIDQNENGLAELVRDLRSTNAQVPDDFRILPLDFGSTVMQQMLASVPQYDLVLNFAALKHVRSERDAYSALQLLDTNVVRAARLLRWLAARRFQGRYFAVSTDKAANPVNLMGASKRAMEHVMFSTETSCGIAASSARFANVAFSDGSLLQSFLRRIEKHQPLAAPRDTRRYFISLAESGQICALAATCVRGGHLLVPRLDPKDDLVDLESVAVAVVRAFGWEPAFYDDEAAARAAVESDLALNRYPILLTPLDTTGEKPYEEFIGAGENSVEIGMPNLLAVPYVGRPPGAVARFLALLEGALLPEGGMTKPELVRIVGDLLPEFHHAETGQSLDNRM